MRPDIVDHLRDTLIEKQERNPQYSLRSFARDLNLSSGKLSEILRSKSKMTLNTFEQISTSLNFDEEIYNSLRKDLKDFNEGRRKLSELSIDEENFIMTNDHLAILGLMNISIFKHCTKWIASSLKRDEKAIIKLIDELIEVDLVTFKDDKYTTNETGAKVSPPSDTQVTKMLKNGFIRASNASEHYGNEQHWFSNMVIPAPKNEVKLIGKKFWNAFKEINFEQEKNLDQSDELYEIVVGVYPITNLNSQ